MTSYEFVGSTAAFFCGKKTSEKLLITNDELLMTSYEFVGSTAAFFLEKTSKKLLITSYEFGG